LTFYITKLLSAVQNKNKKKSTDNNALYTVLVAANLRMFVNVSNTTQHNSTFCHNIIKRLLTNIHLLHRLLFLFLQ